MDSKHQHLTLDDRYAIQHSLGRGDSFKEIARAISRDCTTVSKEVRARRIFKQSGCYNQPFNDCASRLGCMENHLCEGTPCRRKLCRRCTKFTCSKLCPNYVRQACPKRDKPPYVCDGCADLPKCSLEKTKYSAVSAQREYQTILSESRSGVNTDKREISRIDDILSPLLQKGQSIHHICSNHAAEIMLSERTVYKYVDMSLFRARNIDMPLKVRFRPRKKRRGALKIDKRCRVDRTYADFLAFVEKNQGAAVVEMDTVHGEIGGKVLLTLHFVNAHFMIARLMDYCTADCVSKEFDLLRRTLGDALFAQLFFVIKTDNGSEFSDPKSIELDDGGTQLARVFYCDPRQSQQKGAAEKNHEMIRRIVPKGEPFDCFTQQDIDLMMSHINSYGRPALNERSPHSVFELLYGSATLEKLGAKLVPQDDVKLRPSLLKT